METFGIDIVVSVSTGSSQKLSCRTKLLLCSLPSVTASLRGVVLHGEVDRSSLFHQFLVLLPFLLSFLLSVFRWIWSSPLIRYISHFAFMGNRFSLLSQFVPQDGSHLYSYFPSCPEDDGPDRKPRFFVRLRSDRLMRCSESPEMDCLIRSCRHSSDHWYTHTNGHDRRRENGEGVARGRYRR